MGALLYPLFALTAQSPTRRSTFRVVVVVHLMAVAGAGLMVMGRRWPPQLLGHLLLVAGIIEGAFEQLAADSVELRLWYELQHGRQVMD